MKPFVTVHIVALVILCAALPFSSCVEESSVGYIAVEDVDAPQIIVTGLPDSLTVPDTLSALSFQVRAEDYFGISSISVFVNGKEKYSRQVLPTRSVSFIVSIPIDTSLSGKTSAVTAVAMDAYSNTAASSPFFLYVKPTFVATGTWDHLSIPDRGMPTTIRLDTVFVDSGARPTPVYTVVSNSNKGLVKTNLTGNTLTITPVPYLTGTASIVMKATSGKLVLTKKFDVQVVLLAPFPKVFMPDSAFRNILRDQYGFTDLHEEYIVQAQAETLQSLIMDQTPRVSSFTGITAFRGLVSLTIVRKVNTAGTIDLSFCQKLRTLATYFVRDHDLDLSSLVDLESLYIQGSSMDSLQLPTLKHLHSLTISQGRCSSLSVSQNTELRQLILWLSGGGLTSIDLTQNLQLEWLLISQCDRMTSLDISHNTALTYIDLRYNAALTTTYVWTLPLPSTVKLQKDGNNTLILKSP